MYLDHFFSPAAIWSVDDIKSNKNIQTVVNLEVTIKYVQFSNFLTLKVISTSV